MENTSSLLPDTAITGSPASTPLETPLGDVLDLRARPRTDWGVITLLTIHAFVLLLLVGGLVVVVPRFTKIFADFQMKLPFATDLLITISELMVQFIFLVPFALIGLLFVDGLVLVHLRRQERTRGLAWLWFVLLLILMMLAIGGAVVAMFMPLIELMEGLSR
jgi:hypothetical protein